MYIKKQTNTLEDSSSWLLTSDTGDSGIFLESIFELVVEDFSVDKLKYFIGTSITILRDYLIYIPVVDVTLSLTSVASRLKRTPWISEFSTPFCDS